MINDNDTGYGVATSDGDDMVCVIDSEQTCLSVNGAFLEAFGKQEKELVGQRASDPGGQDSFAGLIEESLGRALAGETVEQAALREAREEIGLDPRQVEVLGRLSPLHIPVSKFALHPVVARTGSAPRLRPRKGEVDRILEPRIADLRDPSSLGVETRGSRDRVFRVPYIDVDGEHVWGATAMVLAELLSLLGDPPRPPF